MILLVKESLTEMQIKNVFNIVLFFFLDLIYLTLLLFSALVAVQTILILEYMNKFTPDVKILIFFAWVFVILLSCCGIVLSSYSIYCIQNNASYISRAVTYFLFILVLTEFGVFTITGVLVYITACKAEDIFGSLIDSFVQIIVDKIRSIHEQLLKCEICWNEKMINLISPEIVEEIKRNHVGFLNNGFLDILNGIENIALMFSCLIFLALNFVCIASFVCAYKQFVAGKWNICLRNIIHTEI